MHRLTFFFVPRQISCVQYFDEAKKTVFKSIDYPSNFTTSRFTIHCSFIDEWLQINCADTIDVIVRQDVKAEIVRNVHKKKFIFRRPQCSGSNQILDSDQG